MARVQITVIYLLMDNLEELPQKNIENCDRVFIMSWGFQSYFFISINFIPSNVSSNCFQDSMYALTYILLII
jgi:hypothetical protein